MCILCWVLSRYKVKKIYNVYIVWGAQQVQGDIDVYFVYCVGVLSRYKVKKIYNVYIVWVAQQVQSDTEVHFVYCVGCLVGARRCRCIFYILCGVLNRYKVIQMYICYIVCDAQQVQGDIDVYFVYCVGCLVGTR